MKWFRKINKDIILKGLIILGLIAIFTSLYVKYGKPYINELALRRLDEIRIENIKVLNSKIEQSLQASTTQTIGKDYVIYISIPSEEKDCKNLSLPSLPKDWKYNCSNNENYRKTDGTGWLPVDISGSLDILPVDPINSDVTLNYYTYVASSTIQKSKKINGQRIIEKIDRDYNLTSLIDSSKYTKEVAREDNGVDDIRYELGTNRKIWADALGLIGYWRFDNNVSRNILNNIDNLSLITTNLLENNSGGILLNGINEYIQLDGYQIKNEKKISIEVNISPKIIPQQSGIIQKGIPGYSAFNYGIFIDNDQIAFAINSKLDGVISIKNGPIKNNTNYNIISVVDDERKILELSINNMFTNKKQYYGNLDYTYNPEIFIGKNNNQYYNGKILFIKIYNRDILIKN